MCVYLLYCIVDTQGLDIVFRSDAGCFFKQLAEIINIVYADRNEDGREENLAVQCVLDPEYLKSGDIAELQAKLKHDVFTALEKLPTYKQVNNVIIRETPFVKTTTNKIRRAKDGSPM